MEMEDAPDKVTPHPPRTPRNVVEGEQVERRVSDPIFVQNDVGGRRVAPFDKGRRTDQDVKRAVVESMDDVLAQPAGKTGMVTSDASFEIARQPPLRMHVLPQP